MSQDKAVLPKEVADGIEQIKKSHKLGFIYDLDGIKTCFENRGEPYGVVWRYATHSRENMIIYFHALVNGYEVETPEDKVREMHREWADKQAKAYREREVDAHKASTMFIHGMMATLEALGVTIENVNDFKPFEEVDAE